MTLIETIGNFIKTLFTRIPDNIKEWIVKLYPATGKLLQALESGVAMTIVDFTPFDWDNQLREKLVNILHHVIPTLITIQDADLTTEQLFAELQKFIAQLPKQGQKAFAIKLLSLLVTHLDDNALNKQSKYDALVQVGVSHMKL